MLLINKARLGARCLWLILIFFSTEVAAVNFTQKSYPSDNQSLSKNAKKVVIIASFSLENLLDTLLDDYAKSNDIIITVLYTSTPVAFKQIENGIEADLVLLNDSSLMKQFIELGWLENNEELWQNRLALVKAPKRNSINRLTTKSIFNTKDNIQAQEVKTQKSITSFFSFSHYPSWEEHLQLSTNTARTIVLCDPVTCQLGKWSHEVLKTLNFSALVLQKTSYVSDSQTMRTVLLKNNADFAIMYYSEALKYFNDNIITIIPESMHSPIVYSLGIVSGKKENMSVIDLVLYLKSIPVSMQMLKNGLLLPDNQLSADTSALDVLSSDLEQEFSRMGSPELLDNILLDPDKVFSLKTTEELTFSSTQDDVTSITTQKPVRLETENSIAAQQEIKRTKENKLKEK